MGNNDFKIILEALLDQTSLTEIEKKLAKKKIPLGIDLEFAKSIKDAEKQMDELSARFKSIFNLSDNDARTFAKQYFAEANKAITQNEQAIQRAAKAQDSLTASMARGREKAEQLRQTEEKRQQISQSNAINKNLEREYLQREKIASINNSISEKVQSKIDVGDYDVQIAKIQNGYSKLNLTIEESANKMSSLSAAYSRLQNAKTVDERVNAEKKFQVELKKTTNDLTKSQIAYSTAFKPITELQRTALSTKMQKWLHDNSAAAKDFGAKINELIKKCATLDGAEFNKLDDEFKAITNSAAAAGKLGKTFGDTMKAGMQKFSEWGIASRTVMGVVQAFKDAVKNVYELDNSLLELSKVSDLSADELRNVTEEAYALGETVGKTGTQTLDAITAAKRAGYELKESMSLAEDALKLTNVAEGIDDAGTAMESLIHILKGSGKDSSYAGNILDMINEVSNTQSVNFDNLVDGGERLSAVATQAGMSLEQMFGVLTGGYEVLGNMEKVASGGITILTRLQSIQLPDEEDVLPVAKLQEKINTATKGVVNVVDESTGQLRDAYSILDDINSVWDTLDKNTQEGIAFAAGGTRQKSVFLSWMENWDNVKKSVESATNSIGSADIENEKYLNSLSGKTEKFSSAFEHLSKTLLDQNMLKFFVDLGTTGVSAIDSLVEALTPLGAVSLIGGGILGAKGSGLTVSYSS